MSVSPFAVWIGTTTAAAPVAPLGNDMYSWVSSWYALSRGSVRIKAVPVSTWTGPPTAFVTYNTSFTANSGRTSATTQISYDTPAIFSIDEAVEIQVPQYHAMHSRSVAEIYANTSNFVGSHANLGMSKAVVTFNTSGTDSYYIYRSVGDDFQLGYFLGIPPLTI